MLIYIYKSIHCDSLDVSIDKIVFFGFLEYSVVASLDAWPWVLHNSNSNINNQEIKLLSLFNVKVNNQLFSALLIQVRSGKYVRMLLTVNGALTESQVKSTNPDHGNCNLLKIKLMIRMYCTTPILMSMYSEVITIKLMENFPWK